MDSSYSGTMLVGVVYSLAVAHATAGLSLGASPLSERLPPNSGISEGGRRAACCKQGTVEASCWLEQTGGDALGAIQAAVGCGGADLVTVGRGLWVLNSTLHLNTSHQTVRRSPLETTRRQNPFAPHAVHVWDAARSPFALYTGPFQTNVFLKVPFLGCRSAYVGDLHALCRTYSLCVLASRVGVVNSKL